MNYSPLFRVRVRHEGDTPCTGLELVASADPERGARAFARHHLLVRSVSGGVDVFGPHNEHRRPHVDFEETTFSFELRHRDPALAHKSDLETIRKLKNPVFRRPRSGNELRVHGGGPALAPGVMATVEVRAVHPAWLNHPHEFTITLPHRRVHWVYYIVVRREGYQPTVKDADAARALGFTVEPLTAALAANDPMGASLLAREPRVYRLVSEAPMPIQPLRGLSLRLGDQTMVAELPVPPAHQHAQLITADAQKRDAIYRVVYT